MYTFVSVLRHETKKHFSLAGADNGLTASEEAAPKNKRGMFLEPVSCGIGKMCKVTLFNPLKSMISYYI